MAKQKVFKSFPRTMLSVFCFFFLNPSVFDQKKCLAPSDGTSPQSLHSDRGRKRGRSLERRRCRGRGRRSQLENMREIWGTYGSWEVGGEPRSTNDPVSSLLHQHRYPPPPADYNNLQPLTSSSIQSHTHRYSFLKETRQRHGADFIGKKKMRK